MLWTFNAMTIHEAGGATAAPVAYEVNGREYIASGFGGNPGELMRRCEMPSSRLRCRNRKKTKL